MNFRMIITLCGLLAGAAEMYANDGEAARQLRLERTPRTISTQVPVEFPTVRPTAAPTAVPTAAPTAAPTTAPTAARTAVTNTYTNNAEKSDQLTKDQIDHRINEMSQRTKFAELELDAAKKKFGPASKEFREAKATLNKFKTLQSTFDRTLKGLLAEIGSMSGSDQYQIWNNNTAKLEESQKSYEASRARNVASYEDAQKNRGGQWAGSYMDSIRYNDQSIEQVKRNIQQRKVVDKALKAFAALEKKIKSLGLASTMDSLNTVQKSRTTTSTYSYMGTTYESIYVNNSWVNDITKSGARTEFEKRYGVVDLDRAVGKLSADAVDMIIRERGANSARSAADQRAITNALYEGQEFVDRQNNRVRFSQVVLRPNPQSVNRVYMTDRRDGDYLGLSIVSLLQVFNKALPADWGRVVATALNSQPLAGGLPSYYRESESLSLRGPNTCYLCVTQNFSAPTQISGQWSQAYTEHYNIQGLDRGFLRVDAAGNLLSGSDSISVSKTMADDNQSVTFTYTNQTSGGEMFSATYRLVGQEASNRGSLLDIAPLDAGSVGSWRGFGSAPTGTRVLVELTIRSPNFTTPVREIDFVLTGDIFKEVF